MKLTPMLEQYFEIKRQVPDAILFYRLGDFYEMFFEDAEKAAPILDLVLTARGRGQEHEAPMCGVPYHAAEGHIAKLIRSGFRVAICEQVEDAAAAKGLVRREIIRVVTPGTATESSIVERESCYLLALAKQDERVGAAYLDVSTGDFFVTTYRSLEDARLFDDVARLGAREVVVPRDTNGFAGRIADRSVTATTVEDSMFEIRGAADYLTRHFKTQSLRGFGLDADDPRVAAAGAALRYAAASHKRPLDHVQSLRIDDDSDYLQLDAATLANLEILESRDAGRPRASLWSVVNATRTAIGGRTLRTWITRPLIQHDAIFDRHDAVDELTRSRTVVDAMTQRLGRIADLERLVSRITLRSASPREVLTLADSLLAVEELRDLMRPLNGPLLGRLRDALDPVPAAVSRIATS